MDACSGSPLRLGAEILCRRLEDESDPDKPQARPRTKIADAIKSFRDDEDARQLTEGTLKKSRYFFETQLKEWAEMEKLVYLDQLTPALLTKFRAGWTNAAQIRLLRARGRSFAITSPKCS